jgi:catechol 2,3-dioxygenase-like lactoylglutathione lyase family enzyme
MDMKLELIPIPVADVDRAKTYYVDQIGFQHDHEVQPTPTLRIVQLTPPGSACSIVIGTGLGGGMQPGSIQGVHLVVRDIAQTRDLLASRGVAVSAIEDMGGVKYVYFSDPDGNSWALQELPERRG